MLRKALQVSVVRSLYLSARFRAQIIVFRGTRVRLGAGARIAVDPGGRLLLGADDAGGTADYVRIGAGGRVTVGDGAVVAAGSVVSTDVPERSIVAGNPARVVRENVSWRW